MPLPTAMYKLALLGMLVATTQGCVLGARPAPRHVAMAIDGTLVAGAIAIMATANHSSPELAQGIFDSAANSIQTDVGAAVLIAGLVGLVINLGLAPDEPVSAVRPLSPAPTVRVAPSAGLSLSALTIDP